MAALVIRGGDIHAPEPIGVRDVVVDHHRIVAITDAETRGDVDTIDATDCVVVPGLVDVHEHLIGGSGERGFASRTPEIFLPELIAGGITTVVGCLGVDTTTRTMPDLLAKGRALTAEGVTAFVYTGGYPVPPATLTGAVRTDVLFVPEVLGVGELAIADRRASPASVAEIAHVVADAWNAGTLAGKRAVTHFHVGDRPRGLATLTALLDDLDIVPEALYPTHVERSDALMREAIALTRRGVTIDIDTVEEDLGRWLRVYVDADADPARLTVSSDAGISAPHTLLAQLRACAVDEKWPLERLLPRVTPNPARVLGLPRKGRLRVGADADLLVLRRDGLELVHVTGRGRVLLRDGFVTCAPGWVDGSNRAIAVRGTRAGGRP